MRAASVGELLEGLRSLLELPVVGDVRGAGLLASVELVADKAEPDPDPGATAGDRRPSARRRAA